MQRWCGIVYRNREVIKVFYYIECKLAWPELYALIPSYKSYLTSEDVLSVEVSSERLAILIYVQIITYPNENLKLFLSGIERNIYVYDTDWSNKHI